MSSDEMTVSRLQDCLDNLTVNCALPSRSDHVNCSAGSKLTTSLRATAKPLRTLLSERKRVSDEFSRASRIGANGYALQNLVDYGEATLDFERAILNLRSCIDTYDNDHKDVFEPDATMASLLGDPINNILSNTSSDYTHLYAILRKKWDRTKLKVRDRVNTRFVKSSIGALKKDPEHILTKGHERGFPTLMPESVKDVEWRGFDARNGVTLPWPGDDSGQEL